MMGNAHFVPGSFRDPRGSVFCADGRIFRTINKCAVSDFEAVEASGILEALRESGSILGWSEANRTKFELPEEAVRVIEHEKIEFISHPYEWSFGALKDAALTHLDVQLTALDHTMVLSDATAYNIQFVGAHPVFIDFLSLRPYRDGEFWAAHKQFCEQFLNPLLLQASLAVPFNAWYRGALEGIPSGDLAKLLGLKGWLSGLTLVNVMLPAYFDRKARKKSNNADAARAMKTHKLPISSYRQILMSLRKRVANLKLADEKTVWLDYAKQNSYLEDEVSKKIEFVGNFVTEIQPKMVWDIGCNTGEYAALALAHGAGRVIGFELDTGALEKAYQRAQSLDKPFTPLSLDILNPSPSMGWNEEERPGLMARRNADGIIALAVIHHISVARNVPLDRAVRWLVALAPRGVIEFVPKKDPMVQELLSLREDIFETYTDEQFDAAISTVAKVVRSRTVTNSGRRLIQFERFSS